MAEESTFAFFFLIFLPMKPRIFAANVHRILWGSPATNYESAWKPGERVKCMRGCLLARLYALTTQFDRFHLTWIERRIQFPLSIIIYGTRDIEIYWYCRRDKFAFIWHTHDACNWQQDSMNTTRPRRFFNESSTSSIRRNFLILIIM